MATPTEIDQIIARLAADQFGLVPHQTLKHLRHISDKAISRRRSSGLLVPVITGVSALSAPSPPSPEQVALAAALIVDKAVVSHRSAAVLWGVLRSSTVAEITLPSELRCRLSGLQVHRSRIPWTPSDTRWKYNAKVSAPERNLVELAATVEADELEGILDSYVHERLTTLTRIASTRARWTRAKGTTTLDRLLEDRLNGMGITRSWLERKAAKVLRSAGIPEPVRNHPVTVAGRQRFLDLAWPLMKIGVEADSWKHHANPRDWGRTRTRDRQLQAAGWIIVPCVVADTRSPEEFVRSIRSTLESRSLRGQFQTRMGGQSTTQPESA